jgi:hypothetical protein
MKMAAASERNLRVIGISCGRCGDTVVALRRDQSSAAVPGFEYKWKVRGEVARSGAN